MPFLYCCIYNLLLNRSAFPAFVLSASNAAFRCHDPLVEKGHHIAEQEKTFLSLEMETLLKDFRELLEGPNSSGGLTDKLFKSLAVLKQAQLNVLGVFYIQTFRISSAISEVVDHFIKQRHAS